ALGHNLTSHPENERTVSFKAHRGEKPVIAQAVWTDGRWSARENAFTPELLKQWQELKQRIEQQEKQVQER
ncbi:MAG: hypothetical protein DCF22_24685, partial [Leptolyngbya sp.]